MLSDPTSGRRAVAETEKAAAGPVPIPVPAVKPRVAATATRSPALGALNAPKFTHDLSLDNFIHKITPPPVPGYATTAPAARVPLPRIDVRPPNIQIQNSLHLSENRIPNKEILARFEQARENLVSGKVVAGIPALPGKLSEIPAQYAPATGVFRRGFGNMGLEAQQIASSGLRTPVFHHTQHEFAPRGGARAFAPGQIVNHNTLLHRALHNPYVLGTMVGTSGVGGAYYGSKGRKRMLPNTINTLPTADAAPYTTSHILSLLRLMEKKAAPPIPGKHPIPNRMGNLDFMNRLKTTFQPSAVARRPLINEVLGGAPLQLDRNALQAALKSDATAPKGFGHGPAMSQLLGSTGTTLNPFQMDALTKLESTYAPNWKPGLGAKIRAYGTVPTALGGLYGGLYGGMYRIDKAFRSSPPVTTSPTDAVTGDEITARHTNTPAAGSAVTEGQEITAPHKGKPENQLNTPQSTSPETPTPSLEPEGPNWMSRNWPLLAGGGGLAALAYYLHQRRKKKQRAAEEDELAGFKVANVRAPAMTADEVQDKVMREIRNNTLYNPDTHRLGLTVPAVAAMAGAVGNAANAPHGYGGQSAARGMVMGSMTGLGALLSQRLVKDQTPTGNIVFGLGGGLGGLLLARSLLGKHPKYSERNEKKAAVDPSSAHRIAYNDMMPLAGRRELTPEEELLVARGKKRWLPKIFNSMSTKPHQMMASPLKQGLLVGGATGAGAAALLHLLANSRDSRGRPDSALAGLGKPAIMGSVGLGVGGLAGVLAGMNRKAINDDVEETMRRLPPESNYRDMMADPAWYGGARTLGYAQRPSNTSNTLFNMYMANQLMKSSQWWQRRGSWADEGVAKDFRIGEIKVPGIKGTIQSISPESVAVAKTKLVPDSAAKATVGDLAAASEYKAPPPAGYAAGIDRPPAGDNATWMQSNWPYVAGGGMGVTALLLALSASARKREKQKKEQQVKQADWLGRKYNEGVDSVVDWAHRNPERAEQTGVDAITGLFGTTPLRMMLGANILAARAPQGYAAQGAMRGAGYGLGAGLGSAIGTGIHNVAGDPSNLSARLALQLGGTGLGLVAADKLLGKPTYEVALLNQKIQREKELAALKEKYKEIAQTKSSSHTKRADPQNATLLGVKLPFKPIEAPNLGIQDNINSMAQTAANNAVGSNGLLSGQNMFGPGGFNGFLDRNRWANYALWGAPIGAGLGLVGGLFGGRKKKRNILGDALAGGLLGAGAGGLLGGAVDLWKGDPPPPEDKAPPKPVDNPIATDTSPRPESFEDVLNIGGNWLNKNNAPTGFQENWDKAFADSRGAINSTLNAMGTRPYGPNEPPVARTPAATKAYGELNHARELNNRAVKNWETVQLSNDPVAKSDAAKFLAAARANLVGNMNAVLQPDRTQLADENVGTFLTPGKGLLFGGGVGEAMQTRQGLIDQWKPYNDRMQEAVQRGVELGYNPLATTGVGGYTNTGDRHAETFGASTRARYIEPPIIGAGAAGLSYLKNKLPLIKTQPPTTPPAPAGLIRGTIRAVNPLTALNSPGRAFRYGTLASAAVNVGKRNSGAQPGTTLGEELYAMANSTAPKPDTLSFRFDTPDKGGPAAQPLDAKVTADPAALNIEVQKILNTNPTLKDDAGTLAYYLRNGLSPDQAVYLVKNKK